MRSGPDPPLGVKAGRPALPSPMLAGYTGGATTEKILAAVRAGVNTIYWCFLDLSNNGVIVRLNTSQVLEVHRALAEENRSVAHMVSIGGWNGHHNFSTGCSPEPCDGARFAASFEAFNAQTIADGEGWPGFTGAHLGGLLSGSRNMGTVEQAGVAEAGTKRYSQTPRQSLAGHVGAQFSYVCPGPIATPGTRSGVKPVVALTETSHSRLPANSLKGVRRLDLGGPVVEPCVSQPNGAAPSGRRRSFSCPPPLVGGLPARP